MTQAEPVVPRTETELVIPTSVRVDIIRRSRRALCPSCRRKRVLYAVELAGHPERTFFGQSAFRCGHCWGVR